MKTAIYIEDGLTQLVLTPENDWEKNCIEAFYQKKNSIEIKKGEFYACQGGYIRQQNYPGQDDFMLIIRKEETK
jgi:hypothetical protein